MRLQKRPIVATAATVAILACLGSSTQAFGTTQGALTSPTADTSAGSEAPEDLQAIAAQVSADEFDAYREATPVEGYSSYAIRDGVLVYYIAGGAKGAVADRLQSLRAKHGVEIVIHDTPLGDRRKMNASFAELSPALAKIPEYSTMRPTSDRQGIEIGVEGKLTDASRAKFEELFGNAFPGVPISYVEATFAFGRDLAGRQDDDNPYKAGGAIFVPYDIINGSRECSLGFRAYKQSLAKYVQLTADHCYHPETWKTSTGQSVGISGQRSTDLDAMVIEPALTKSFSQSMFYSSWYSTLKRPVPVGYNPGDGTTVYANGAFRGQSTQEVIAIDLWGDGTSPGPYAVMESVNGGFNVGPGDSGGPVYNAPTSVGHAVGRGLIKGSTADSPEAPCSQGASNGGTPCFTRVIFSQIDEVEDSLGVEVK